MKKTLRHAMFAALLAFCIPLCAQSTAEDRHSISEALTWVRAPHHDLVEYDYVMTARVRLLIFWAGKDDVGGGYIRRGVSRTDARQETFQVLFGSDPVKVPRAINRWGAGTEVVWHKEAVNESSKPDDAVASAFFGFMKASKGKTVSEMQTELKKEKDHGEHQFTGILSRVEPGRGVSLVVPLASTEDFNLHQYEQAEPLMLEKLESSDRPLKNLNASDRCGRASEFLGTVAELLHAALLEGAKKKSLCYLYDAQENTLTLESVQNVPSIEVKVNAAKGGVLFVKTYENLLQTEFVSESKTDGKKSNFEILMGTQGTLRGVPVQIRYQPNWWFQVILNLQTGANGELVQARVD